MLNNLDFHKKIQERIKDPLCKEIYDKLVLVTQDEKEVYYGVSAFDTEKEKKELLRLLKNYEVTKFSTVLDMILDIDESSN